MRQKFKLVSDLHLEFYRKRMPTKLIKQQPEWEPPVCDDDRDTVLLLAGDIDVGVKAKDWITRMCDRFQVVIYILGNHEFYNHTWHEVKENWAALDMPSNFTFLDDGVCTVGNTRVIGGTLWTRVTDPFMVWSGPKRMADYPLTTVREYGNYRQMNVQDTNRAHTKTTNYIREELTKPWNGKTIVMTHHLPHPLCVAEQFKGSNLNCFFMTDLDHIIRNFDIDFWVHGHTHNNVDVRVHGTRILCNPMGYHGIQLNQEFKEDLTFEC